MGGGGGVGSRLRARGEQGNYDEAHKIWRRDLAAKEAEVEKYKVRPVGVTYEPSRATDRGLTWDCPTGEEGAADPRGRHIYIYIDIYTYIHVSMYTFANSYMLTYLS